MGILSELVVARKSEAQRVAESTNPTGQWQGIDWKGLDQIKLASLWAILEGVEIDVEGVVSRSENMKLLAEVSEDGPWVFEIPDELRDLLGDLAGEGQDQIQTVSDAWAATEELQDWDYSDVTGLLQQLIDLADGARLEDKHLLLWICL